MNLQEVFDQLSYGELSQWSIGGQPQGEINENNYERVLAHVNLGLTSIYKRFNLKEGRVDIQLSPDLNTYVLHNKFAQSNTKSRELVKYLLDSKAIPFKNDVFKVERVQVDSGLELPLNLGGDPLSVTTPNLTTLKVPQPILVKAKHLAEDYLTDKLSVTYRANHDKLEVTLGYFDPTRVELHLPYSHLTALVYFVAGRVSAPTGMTTEERLNNVWPMKYEQECQRLEQENLQIDLGVHNSRLIRTGWV